jgi:hypothetical protein
MRSALEALRRTMSAAEAPHIHIDAQWLDLGGGPGALSVTLAAAVRHHNLLLRGADKPQPSPRQRRALRGPRRAPQAEEEEETPTPQSMVAPAALVLREDGPAVEDAPQWSGEVHRSQQQTQQQHPPRAEVLQDSLASEQQRAVVRAATPSALPRLAPLGNHSGSLRPSATPEPGVFGVRGVAARPSEAAPFSTVPRRQPSATSTRHSTPGESSRPSSRANKQVSSAAAPVSPNVAAW